jgi:hypothetical protein
MTDFCLSAGTLTWIARQTELMDRMCTYLGATPEGYRRGLATRFGAKLASGALPVGGVRAVLRFLRRPHRGRRRAFRRSAPTPSSFTGAPVHVSPRQCH